MRRSHLPLLPVPKPVHALLLLGADKLAGCCEGSEEAIKLEHNADPAEAYEPRR
jgi:hypothetical protein